MTTFHKPKRVTRKKLPLMSAEERLWMGPIEKWRRYRKFPWKFILHLIIAALTIGQLLLLYRYPGNYAGNYAAFRDAFLPAQSDGASVLADAFLYTLDDIRAAVSTAVSSYYTYNVTRPGMFSFVLGEDGRPIPPLMHWHNYTLGRAAFEALDMRTTTYTFPLTPQQPLGPLASPTLLTDLQLVTQFEIEYHLLAREHLTSPPILIEWISTITYVNAGNGADVAVIFSLTSESVAGDNELPWVHPIRFYFSAVYLVLAVVVASLVLKTSIKTLKLISQSGRSLEGERVSTHDALRPESFLPDLMKSTRGRPLLLSESEPAINEERSSHRVHRRHKSLWQQMSCKKRFKFFNGWLLLALFTQLWNIITAVCFLTGLFTNMNSIAPRLFVGLNCALSCIVMLQYFRWNHDFYLLVLTLAKAIPSVARYMLNLAPVFLAYTLFGVAFFSACDADFADFDNAAVTLFSILNGDVVLSNFSALYGCEPFVSRAYLYTFVALFVYVILKIFVALIQDAFVTTRFAQDELHAALETSNQSDFDDSISIDSSNSTLAGTQMNEAVTLEEAASQVRNAGDLSRLIQNITARAMSDSNALVTSFLDHQTVMVEPIGQDHLDRHRVLGAYNHVTSSAGTGIMVPPVAGPSRLDPMTPPTR